MEPRQRLKELVAARCVLRGEFILVSGQKANVYFDCKRATLDPEGIHLIATLILETIDRLEREDGAPIEAIGGPTIGADPVVSHVAGLSWQRAGAAPRGSTRRPLRAFLVRKFTKDHGTQRLIENEIPRGVRVAVFEDVVTSGVSTLDAIAKVEAAGLEVAAVISLVDREQGGAEALSRYRYLPIFKRSEFGL